MAIPLSRSLCLSAGHSYGNKGAFNGELDEHYFNVLMCEYLMAEMRVAQIPCDIVDPFENNLIRIGSSALDHYCFIETHLNSSTVKSINYAVGCTDTRFSNRDRKSVV